MVKSVILVLELILPHSYFLGVLHWIYSGDLILSKDGSLVTIRAYLPYTLVGPPVRGLVHDPLAVYSSRTDSQSYMWEHLSIVLHGGFTVILRMSKPVLSFVPFQHLRARSRQLCSTSGSWLGCSCGSSGAHDRVQEQHWGSPGKKNIQWPSEYRTSLVIKW